MKSHGNRFGRKLKALRSAAGLSLKAVAARSSADPRGRISDGYLSQLESGRVVNVSFHKLLALASILGVQVHDLLEALPEPVRAQRQADLDGWSRAGFALPKTLEHDPALYIQVDARVDELLGRLSRDVRLPLKSEQDARREIRTVTAASVLPIMIQRDRRSIARFWQQQAPTRTRWERWSTHTWSGVIEKLTTWIIYGEQDYERLFAPLLSWTIDFDDGLATCAFGHEHKQLCYERVPVAAVLAVRWRTSAHLLWTTATPATLKKRLLPPPPVTDALRDYVANLANPMSVLPVSPHDSPTPAAMMRLRALLTNPQADSGATPGPEIHAAIEADRRAAEFIRSASDSMPTA